MNKLSVLTSLFSLGCMLGSLSISAVAESRGGTVDLAIAYNVAQANTVGGMGFTAQGAGVQLQDRLWRGLGIIADLDGLHSGSQSESSGGFNLITYTFGPRYTWSPVGRRMTAFGEALGGEVRGIDGIFPSANGAVSTGNSSALLLGGGLDLPLSRKVAVRAIQADWLRTQLPNATTNVQNSLRLGFGLRWRLR